MPQMPDDQLLAAISAAEETALGSLHGAISSDRADAIDRYYGKAYGDELPGRSTVVSRDVADVVEGVVSNVIKPFVGGDQIVVFDPLNENDEKQAQQETDYVNFIAMQRNNGFVWLVSAVKDALLLRSGYVKCDWRVRQDVVTEDYHSLADEELGLIAQDKDVQIVQHSEYPDPDWIPPQQPMPPPGAQVMGMQPEQQGPPMLHDIKVKRTRPTEYVEICPTPPDEILVSERAREASLQNVDFVQHRTRKTLSELREAGYKVDDDLADDDRGETIEDYSRVRFGDKGDIWDDNTSDPARRVVLYKESYIRIDRDGDGIAELRRVCTVGQTLLADDDCDIIPIAAYSGVLVPHQHLGMSVYDLVEDLAKIKTALMRSFLDNRRLQNDGRFVVNPDMVNVDDFLVSRPGGVVRTINGGDPSTAVMALSNPDTSSGALQGLEYLDTVRENRTGYTRNSAGMDNDALTNSTATGMSMQLSQSQLRLEMIARTIAETGVRDTFRIVHALTLKHSSKADKVRLNGTWAAVDPRSWTQRSDLSITIGLGTGTSEQQLGKLMALGPLMQQGQAMGLVGVEQGYNYAAEAFKLSGYKDTERFIKAPEMDPQTGQPKQPPPPPPPPEVQVEQMRQQGKGQEIQANAATANQRLQMEGQLKMQEMQAQDTIKQREAAAQQAVQQSNDQRDAAKLQMEYHFKDQQSQREFAQRDIEHQRDVAKEIEIANIRALAIVEAARIKAAAMPSPVEAAEAKGAGY